MRDLLQIEMVVSRESLDKTIDLLPLSAYVDLGILVLNSYFWTGVTSFEIKNGVIFKQLQCISVL